LERGAVEKPTGGPVHIRRQDRLDLALQNERVQDLPGAQGWTQPHGPIAQATVAVAGGQDQVERKRSHRSIPLTGEQHMLIG
jgi:hypothetical protein